MRSSSKTKKRPLGIFTIPSGQVPFPAHDNEQELIPNEYQF